MLSGLSMSDDITAKMSLTGVTPALNVRPTPPEHKQEIELVYTHTHLVQGDLKEGIYFRSLGETRNTEMGVLWWTNGQEVQGGGIEGVEV